MTDHKISSNTSFKVADLTQYFTAYAHESDKFKVGDKVRVAYDRTYFTTTGIDMVITGIRREEIDGEIHAFYVTDHPCSIHGSSYNDFELVAIGD